MAAPSYATKPQVVGHYGLRIFVALVCVFLVAPIFAIIPLSFSSGTFLSYPMPGFSFRWYEEVLAPRPWMFTLRNSLFVAIGATIFSTTLGTLAALAMARKNLRSLPVINAFLLAPMIVPLIITAVGLYFFFAQLGLTNSFTGLIIAHTALCLPFVLVTVAATLEGFDGTLVRAAQSLGAPPLTVFRRVILPIISPGVASGALFAFAISFDEVVVAVFLAGPTQRTLPKQMFSGLRENIDPSILAMATLLVVMATGLMIVAGLLKRRSERMRGLSG
ncbi:MAG: ABC transporter permease [Pseudomonadota bacterium]|uniref:ABC transporter permease n=1 Tax=Fodinicurvata fenggangensis TaxID=1121830 RepID=UPI00054E70B5|nr:ABC transporter permease [Fodinicurvata fenggangensis]